jgi:cytochrome P450
MTDIYWDPFSTELRNDPYPLWKRMRDEAPVWYNDRFDFWTLTRFHDIEAAHKDWETFSSAHGTSIETMTDEPSQGGMIIWLDPQKHTVMRKLVSRAFTNRRIASIEDHIREVCAELLDAQIGSGQFDYVQDFSAILPPTIIAGMLGVPEGDQESLRHSVDDIFRVQEGSVGMDNPVAQNALAVLREYLGGQFTDRRANPRDDMFTDLVQAEITVDGKARRLTDDELADFALVMFAAGTETVARYLGWIASLLDEYPDQRAELAANFSLIPNAAEEFLRIEPPSPVNARWTKRDVTIHDVTIPGESKVVLLTGAAGRDERKFSNPDVLDIHRKIDLHMTLGCGIHFCLGAALARMEGRIGLEETLKRWPKWEVDRDKTVLLYTSTVRGPLNLPISV